MGDPGLKGRECFLGGVGPKAGCWVGREGIGELLFRVLQFEGGYCVQESESGWNWGDCFLARIGEKPGVGKGGGVAGGGGGAGGNECWVLVGSSGNYQISALFVLP